MAQVTLGGFGHKKRANLGAILLDAVQTKRTLCLHRLAEDRNQAIRFGNFLANSAVSTHEMLVTAGRQTNERATGRHILAVMDTTDVQFPTQTDKKCGFGRGSDGTHPGLFFHPVLAVDAANGGIVGLTDRLYRHESHPGPCQHAENRHRAKGENPQKTHRGQQEIVPLARGC